MAAPALPDFDELALELVHLEHRVRDVERRLVKAQDRQTAFPNVVTERHVASLTAELAQTRAAMDAIRAQLVPIMRTR